MSNHMNPADEGDNQRALELLAEQAEERVRRAWHEGRWWFSVVDVVGFLTESPTPNKYWTEYEAPHHR